VRRFFSYEKLLLLLCAAGLGLSPAGGGEGRCRRSRQARQELSPVGAEKGANKDGTIPAWTGGRKQDGALVGEFPHDDAIDGEQPSFHRRRISGNDGRW